MSETASAPSRTRPVRGPLKKSSLENAALYYLERHASSVDGLRRVLARRVDRAAREERCDRQEATGWVEEIVARFAASGLVDDKVFAEAKVASRRRRGESANRIQQALRQKGVERQIVDGALAGQDGDDRAGAELEAAWRLARRRRLGPYRPPEARQEMRQRDLGSLARAGFDRGTATAVIDAEMPPE